MSGVCDVRVFAILKEVEASNFSTVVEVLVEWQGVGVVLEDLFYKRWSLYCC